MDREVGCIDERKLERNDIEKRFMIVIDGQRKDATMKYHSISSSKLTIHHLFNYFHGSESRDCPSKTVI